MPTADAAARAQLDVAAGSDAPVRLVRSIKGAEKLDGFVVAVGRRWAVLDRLHTDSQRMGFVGFRVTDVKKVSTHGDGSFLARAVRALGVSPSTPAKIDLDSTQAFVNMAGDAFGMLAIFNEVESADQCFLGRPERVGPKVLRLREVTTTGEWETPATSWTLSSLTRVDFDGHYERALAAIAGEPPTP